MSSPHGLPAELLEIVLSDPVISVFELASCSLTCRAWLPFCRTHMFFTVHLTPVNLASFLTLLAHRFTTFTPFVREMTVSGFARLVGGVEVTVDQRLVQELIPKLCIFPRLTSLKLWKVESRQKRSSSSLFSVRRARTSTPSQAWRSAIHGDLPLRQLDFDMVDPVYVQQIISMCPSLDTLGILRGNAFSHSRTKENCTTFLMRRDQILPKEHDLHTLTLDSESLRSRGALTWLMSHDRISDCQNLICNLKLWDYTNEVNRCTTTTTLNDYLRMLGSSLKSLELRCLTLDENVKGDISQALRLAHNTSLRQLRLLLFASPHLALILTKLVSTMPPSSLEKLEVFIEGFDPRYRDSWLDTQSALNDVLALPQMASLRSVELSLPYRCFGFRADCQGALDFVNIITNSWDSRISAILVPGISHGVVAPATFASFWPPPNSQSHLLLTGRPVAPSILVLCRTA